MDDRTLLELAAKAAGINLKFEDIYPLRFVGHNPDAGNQENWSDWNPLTDDGDALRLAVKLKIAVHFGLQAGSEEPKPLVVVAWHWAQTFAEGMREEADNDTELNSVTRRAIVRAAAEIGKSI